MMFIFKQTIQSMLKLPGKGFTLKICLYYFVSYLMKVSICLLSDFVFTWRCVIIPQKLQNSWRGEGLGFGGTRDGGRRWVIIIIIAIISIAPYFTEKGEHTPLYKINNNIYIKIYKIINNVVIIL